MTRDLPRDKYEDSTMKHLLTQPRSKRDGRWGRSLDEYLAAQFDWLLIASLG